MQSGVAQNITRLLIVATVCASFFVLSMQPVLAQSACVKLTQDLKFQDRDSNTNGEVSRLQRFLAQQDSLIYPEKRVTGYFDPDVQLAVYRWKKANGLISATNPPANWGVVDAKTRSAMAVCKRPPVRSSTAVASSAARINENGCPVLSRVLSRGARGEDVKTLQAFLANRNLLPADSATGFFGGLTEAALQSWQRSEGIVSAGSPTTSGYGSTGPRTRAKIAESCSSVASTPPPTPASLVVCASTKVPYCQEGFKPGGTCNLQCVLDDAPPPAWVLEITGNPPPMQPQPPVVTETIPTPSVSTPPPIVTPTQQTGTSGESASLAAKIETASFTVTFSGRYNTGEDCTAAFELDFGDGQSEKLPTGCTATDYSKTHTYANPGTYDAYIAQITTVGTDQFYDTQAEILITVRADGSVELVHIARTTDTGADPYRGLASVLVALEYVVLKLFSGE